LPVQESRSLAIQTPGEHIRNGTMFSLGGPSPRLLDAPPFPGPAVQNWREVYELALLELDISKLPGRVEATPLRFQASKPFATTRQHRAIRRFLQLLPAGSRDAFLQTALRRPLSKLMTRTTNPTTSSKWIRLPPTCKLKPRSHMIKRTMKMGPKHVNLLCSFASTRM
jgi:hypothetical protein